MFETRAFQKGKMAMRNAHSCGVRFQGQEQSQQQEQTEKTINQLSLCWHIVIFINCEDLMLQNHISTHLGSKPLFHSATCDFWDFQVKNPKIGTVHVLTLQTQ